VTVGELSDSTALLALDEKFSKTTGIESPALDHFAIEPDYYCDKHKHRSDPERAKKQQDWVGNDRGK
jgi:hypothetical protein